MQFGPKIALIEKGNALETIRLNGDRSVSNWPAAVKANAIADGIVISTDGTATTFSSLGLQTARFLGSNVVSASSDLGMVFKSDGTAQVYSIDGYNALFQNSPLTDQVKDVVAGAGEPVTKHYYFLKRDGKVERWTWNDQRQSDGRAHSLQFSSVLPTRNVMAIKSMIGSP
jgi:hypothetical protein